MRIFTAFSIPTTIKMEMIRIQNKITRLSPKMRVKWVDKENMHITLDFFGDLGDSQLHMLKDILAREVSKYHCFNYSLKNIDGFPDVNRPRTLIVKAEEKDRQNIYLHNKLLKILKQAGLVSDSNDWQPHITLGRIKGGWNNKVKLEEIGVKPLTWRVEEVHLCSSQLTPNGPIHKVLERYSLSR